jgi:hypothetical protein
MGIDSIIKSSIGDKNTKEGSGKPTYLPSILVYAQ